MNSEISGLRVGNGFDAHAFCEGRPLILGGVRIDFNKGLAGHSDADVLVHAIIDALLGAAGLGDIGILFPDSDVSYKDISSILLLKRVSELLVQRKITILNIDSVIICQKPKISTYADEIKKTIADTLGIKSDQLGIKGKTTENLGFTGREEGIAVHSVALVHVPS
jgi:2-C-methyl-D-erythritol 2,4-cyclodiphosphate synthase